MARTNHREMIHPSIRIVVHGDARGDQEENEDQGEGNLPKDAAPSNALAKPQVEHSGQRGAAQKDQHAGDIGAALSLEAGSEENYDKEVDRVEEMQDRADVVRPLELHAQARQVLGHEASKAHGHAGAGEAQNEHRAQVVNRAKNLSKQGIDVDGGASTLQEPAVGQI